MAENFIAKNTPNLERIANDASSQDEDINVAFERMRSELRSAQGITPPPSESDRLYGGPGQSAPTEYAFTKEIRWNESTGRRPLILRAHTAEDLAALEAQVTR